MENLSYVIAGGQTSGTAYFTANKAWGAVYITAVVTCVAAVRWRYYVRAVKKRKCRRLKVQYTDVSLTLVACYFLCKFSERFYPGRMIDVYGDLASLSSLLYCQVSLVYVTRSAIRFRVMVHIVICFYMFVLLFMDIVGSNYTKRKVVADCLFTLSSIGCGFAYVYNGCQVRDHVTMARRTRRDINEYARQRSQGEAPTHTIRIPALRRAFEDSDNSYSYDSYSEDGEDKGGRRNFPAATTLSTIFSQQSSSDDDEHATTRSIQISQLSDKLNQTGTTKLSDNSFELNISKSTTNGKPTGITKHDNKSNVSFPNSEKNPNRHISISSSDSRNTIEDRNVVDYKNSGMSLNILNIVRICHNGEEHTCEEPMSINNSNIETSKESTNNHNENHIPKMTIPAKGDEFDKMLDNDGQGILDFGKVEDLEDSGYVGDTETPIKKKKRKRFITRDSKQSPTLSVFSLSYKLDITSKTNHSIGIKRIRRASNSLYRALRVTTLSVIAIVILGLVKLFLLLNLKRHSKQYSIGNDIYAKTMVRVIQLMYCLGVMMASYHLNKRSRKKRKPVNK